jgi:hypothetical protein
VLTDRHCTPIIAALRLPSSATRNFGGTIDAAVKAHLSAASRKYVLFVDTGYYCGLGTLDIDDRPGVMNASNSGPSWARVDNGCWTAATAAHEIFHMLGAVQKSAPHYDNTGHCTDDHDLMCYQGRGGKKIYIRCRSIGEENRLDCGKDDYFNTAPRSGTYLTRHWNTANSSFLYGGGPARPAPPGPLRAVTATMTTRTSAEVRWTAPHGSRVTGYSIIKDNGDVIWRGNATSWTDAHAIAGRSSYQVQAFNEAGTGPWSAPVTATLPPPRAPGKVRSAGSSPTTITWTENSSIVAGFQLFGLSGDGSVRHLSDQPASARTASDNTLSVLKSWNRYRICAVNDAGQRCADSP